MPVIGTGMSNQSCANAAHGPMVTTNWPHGTSSPSTSTAATCGGPSTSPCSVLTTPVTLPIRSSAPAATAASISLVHSSYGATCAPPSWSM